MTVYERLFGTPERATRTIEEQGLNSSDICFMLGVLSDDHVTKCRNCIYDSDYFGCKRKRISVLDWLNQEVVE